MPDWRSRFRTPPESDIEKVTSIAGLLEIPEYRLFQLAYRDWYGHEPLAADTEAWFDAYMFGDQVPFWVRAFCEKVRRQERDRTLNREALGIRPETRPPRYLRWFVTTLVVLLVVLTVLIFMANQAVHLMPFLQECYFPPCY